MYREFSFLRRPAAALTLLLLVTASDTFADDMVLNNFTHSLTTVYISSEECADTLKPGPVEYMKLITDYLNIFYPQGVSYWILPPATRHIADRSACILAIQEKLGEYRIASRDYKRDYPEQPPPPVLLAYNWGNEPSTATQPSPLPKTPASKGTPWE